jgi:hypothetical protein
VDPDAAPCEVRLEARLWSPETPTSIEDGPRSTCRLERPIEVAEPVLAQLRQLDGSDRCLPGRTDRQVRPRPGRLVDPPQSSKHVRALDEQPLF